MNNKVTVLLGAGAMIDATGVTTKSITNDIRNITDRFDKTKFIEFLYNEMCKYYPNEMVSFEDIFDALETLGSLDSSYNKSTIKRCKPIMGLFTQMKENFSKKLENICLYSQCIDIIDHICEIIYNYDTKLESAVWFKKFFEALVGKDKTLCKNKIYCDIYNLNYDTWLEQTFEKYNDGFEIYDEETFVFRPQKAIDSTDKTIINHLHGQIYFAYHPQNTFGDSIFKYSNYNKARFSRSQGYISSSNTQSRESIYISPIITGLRKTDKILTSPFNIYRFNLQNSILNNNRLIIIGYGFGDSYINALLHQHLSIHGENSRVILIDKIDELMWKRSWGDLQEPTFKIPSAEKYFIYNAFKKEDLYNNKPRMEFPHKIKNKQAIWYMDGFKEVAMNNISEILEFLCL